MGLEGIVAKRRHSRYRSGRCRDWVKIKNIAHPAIERAMLIALSKAPKEALFAADSRPGDVTDHLGEWHYRVRPARIGGGCSIKFRKAP
jgi:hypothetical protein